MTTKLRLLARCHRLARWAWWKRILVALLAVPVCVGLSVALGAAVYFSIYDHPMRHVQRYSHFDQFGRQLTEHYVRGDKVTQQEYDYFLATTNNEITAGIAAVASGIGLFGLTFTGWLWFLSRQRAPARVGLEEQIQAILEAHPDEVKAWGGPSVLHHPGLVDELLRIDDKGGR